MKILAKVDEVSDRYALIHLFDEKLRKNIRNLVSRGKYRQAIREAVSKAESHTEISGAERKHVNAALIITERSAHWDLTV